MKYFKDGKRRVLNVVEDGLIVDVGWYKGVDEGVVKVRLRGWLLEMWKGWFKEGRDLVKVFRRNVMSEWEVE